MNLGNICFVGTTSSGKFHGKHCFSGYDWDRQSFIAIILYAMFLGKDDTPVIIYVVAGFLTAMFFWHLQLFIRTLQLKKQFRTRVDSKDDETLRQTQELLESNPTKELLSEADFTEIVPARVTERTTKNLGYKIERSSKTEE